MAPSEEAIGRNETNYFMYFDGGPVCPYGGKLRALRGGGAFWGLISILKVVKLIYACYAGRGNNS